MYRIVCVEDVLLVKITSKKSDLKRIVLMYGLIVAVCSYLMLGLHYSVPQEKLLHTQLERGREEGFEVLAYSRTPVLAIALVRNEEETVRYVGFWGGFCPLFTTKSETNND